jgi:S-adenosylmethionine hydrolase
MKFSRSLLSEPPKKQSESAWPIVTLTTDFGLSDYFVGSVKGVLLCETLLSGAPGIRLVDITHQIQRHDILSAAFVINEAYRYFPAGSIHLVVVDPGVGTERREVIATHAGHFFVAPDNGILTYLFQNEETVVYQVKKRSLLNLKESATFAGRDHFAPIAALLAKGTEPGELGEPITDYVRIEGLSPRRAGVDLAGKIVYFDHFGNAITNVTGAILKEADRKRICVSLCGKKIEGIKKSYLDGQTGTANLILNSSDRLEIFAPRESARALLKLELLDEVYLKDLFRI